MPLLTAGTTREGGAAATTGHQRYMSLAAVLPWLTTVATWVEWPCCNIRPPVLHAAGGAAVRALRPAAAVATSHCRRCYDPPRLLLRTATAVAATRHGRCYDPPPLLLPATAAVATTRRGRRCYQPPPPVLPPAASVATSSRHHCCGGCCLRPQPVTVAATRRSLCFQPLPLFLRPAAGAAMVVFSGDGHGSGW